MVCGLNVHVMSETAAMAAVCPLFTDGKVLVSWPYWWKWNSVVLGSVKQTGQTQGLTS